MSDGHVYLLCRYGYIRSSLLLQGSRAPNAETWDVGQVSEIPGAVAVLVVKWDQTWALVQTALVLHLRATTMALTKARHPPISIFTGESAPFHSTELLQEFHNFVDRYIICLCFMVLKSQKAKHSICELMASTHDSWLISGQSRCITPCPPPSVPCSSLDTRAGPCSFLAGLFVLP